MMHDEWMIAVVIATIITSTTGIVVTNSSMIKVRHRNSEGNTPYLNSEGNTP